MYDIFLKFKQYMKKFKSNLNFFISKIKLKSGSRARAERIESQKVRSGAGAEQIKIDSVPHPWTNHVLKVLSLLHCLEFF